MLEDWANQFKIWEIHHSQITSLIGLACIVFVIWTVAIVIERRWRMDRRATTDRLIDSLLADVVEETILELELRNKINSWLATEMRRKFKHYIEDMKPQKIKEVPAPKKKVFGFNR